MGIRIAELEIFISDNVPEARAHLQDLNRDLTGLTQAATPAAASTEALARAENNAATQGQRMAAVMGAVGDVLDSVEQSATRVTRAWALVRTTLTPGEMLESLRHIPAAIQETTQALTEQARAEREVATANHKRATESIEWEQRLLQVTKDQVAELNRQTHALNEGAAAAQRANATFRQESQRAVGRAPDVREAYQHTPSGIHEVTAALREQERAQQELGIVTNKRSAEEADWDRRLSAATEAQIALLNEQAAVIARIPAEFQAAGRRIEEQQTAQRAHMTAMRQQAAMSVLQGTGQTLPLLGGMLAGPSGAIAGQLGSNLLGGLTSVLEQATGLVGSIVSTGINGVKSLVGGALGVVGGIFSNIGESAHNAVSGVAGFFGEVLKGGATLAAAYVGLKALHSILSELSEVIVGFSADVERNSKSWAVMLHSVDLANDTLFAIQKTAVLTSYSFDQVERGVRQLIQGGFNLGEVLGEGGLLKDVQDVASSMGSHMLISFDHLSLALGQIRQAGHLTGEEMRQLRNAGVSIPEVFATMSEQTGKTTGELLKLQREGKVTSEMFLTAFHSWTRTNFGGLAEAQAKSFSGAMEQIRESVTLLGSRAFQPLFDRISTLAQRIATFVTSEDGAKWAARFAAALDVVLESIGELTAGFTEGWNTILGIVNGVGKLIYEGLQWLNPKAEHSQSLVDAVEEGVERIMNAYQNLGRELPSTLQPAQDAIRAFREATAPGLQRIEGALFAQQAKDLALIGPSAPAAYREVQATIAELRADATALSPEIDDLKQQVYEATEAWRFWDTEVKNTTATLKDQEQALKPYDDQISKIKQNILGLDIQLAEAQRQWRELNATLQPLRDNLTGANQALEAADERLKAAQISLREGQAGLRDYRQAVTDAAEGVSHLQDRLTTSRDALAGINDQLKDARDNLKDVLGTPLEGTAQFREKISQAKQVVSELNAQYLTMKAGGASEQSLKNEQRLLDLARARLSALQAQQEARITLPEERLRDLAQGGAKEIGYDVKLAGVTQAQAALSPIEAMQQAAEARVRQDQGSLHAAQQIVTARKDELNAQERLLAPRQRAVELAQAERDAALLVKEHAENTLKLEEQRVLGPINNIIAGYTAQKSIAEEDLKLAQLHRAEKSEEFQETRDYLEYAKTQRDEAAQDRDALKKDLEDLVTAQTSLLNLAKEWQQELNTAATQAKSMAAELKREEAERKRLEKEAGLGEGLGPSNRASGAEALTKFKEERERLKKEFGETKVQFATWLGELNTSLSETAPWLGGFFGRLRGFASGTADALSHVFNHDVPGAIATFRGTLEDVGEGLPEVLRGWGISFAAWVQPAAEQLVANLVELGGHVDDWVENRVPVYEENLAGWAAEFVAWARKVWKPLGDLLEAEIFKPLSNWVEVQGKKLGTWVLDNWVTPFADWVFNAKGGVWMTLRPHLIDFIWEINRLITGKEKDEPLEAAGKTLGSTIAKGFADIAGTIAHEIWSALMDALGVWVNNHRSDIALTLFSPMLELGKIIGQLLGDSIGTTMANAIGDKVTQFRLELQRINNTPTLPRPEAPGTGVGQGGGIRDRDLTSGKLIISDNGPEEGKHWAEGVEEGVETQLEMSSPSKVFARIGQQAGAGFAQGMASQLGAVQNVAQEYASAFTEGGKAYFSQAAGQNVRTGFSVNRISELDQKKLDALLAAQEASRKAQADALAKGVVAIDPGKQAIWGGQGSPGYVPQTFPQGPMTMPGPFPNFQDMSAAQALTAGYVPEDRGEYTNVPTIINNYGTVIMSDDLTRSAEAKLLDDLKNDNRLRA